MAPLLQIAGLTLTVPTPVGPLQVLQGVDLEVAESEIVGLVGESGSGKSITCLSLLRLVGARTRVAGSMRYEGREISRMNEAEIVALRGREIAMIGQEPQSALNPVRTIGSQLVETLALDPTVRTSGEPLRRMALRLLQEVGLPDSAQRLEAYPHQLSGGQAQRVLIAMMLARRPRLLLADEPTTALDVTVQAQILSLLRELRRRHGTAILLVTHDLGVVAEICERMAVMYCGRVVECGPVDEVFRRPRHPYTVGLLAARTRIDRRVPRLVAIEGSVPNPRELPPGCSFAARCRHATASCRQVAPAWRETGRGSGHACHHPLVVEAAP